MINIASSYWFPQPLSQGKVMACPLVVGLVAGNRWPLVGVWLFVEVVLKLEHQPPHSMSSSLIVVRYPSLPDAHAPSHVTTQVPSP